MRYGMPYKGSKNFIAEKIIDMLPCAENFYDLFGGGGAISHCAVLSKKYKNVYYNELEPLVYKGFKMAINGEFKNETRWISREDFFKLKDTDPYVAICFSFGNNLKDYAYSPENEKIKKLMHELFFCKDPNNSRTIFYKIIRYLKNKKSTRVFEELENLERSHHLERLQSLQSLGSLQITCTNLSYEQVEIKPNSVIYCDIPYRGTSKYKSEFDYDKFYKWAESQKSKVYISEYEMPENFYLCGSMDKRVTLSNNKKIAKENIYCNKKNHGIESYEQLSL